MKWYHMRGKSGTISVKASHGVAAKAEAAERWGCSSDEIEITGEELYTGYEKPMIMNKEEPG